MLAGRAIDFTAAHKTYKHLNSVSYHCQSLEGHNVGESISVLSFLNSQEGNVHIHEEQTTEPSSLSFFQLFL